MWYRLARRLVRSGMAIPSGIASQKRRTVDQIATPTEAEKMAEKSQRAPRWCDLTIEGKLNRIQPNMDDYMTPTPEALLDVAGVQPAVMGNEPNQTGRPRSGGGKNPTFREGFPASPDPRSRLRVR